MELREEINKTYFLVGTMVLQRNPDKIRREMSFKLQGYDVGED